ncbi:MAG: TolB family protein, partial [Pyrinomonadaceae bacterium]
FGLSLVLVVVGFAGIPAQKRPAWKPEAADLLFTSSRDGNSEIYLLRAGQKEWINLSNNTASDNWPVWSRDGTRIVFQTKRAGNLDIWTMKADGTDQLQLTSDQFRSSVARPATRRAVGVPSNRA